MFLVQAGSLVKVTVDLDFTKRSTAERLPLAGQVKRSRTVATDESTPIPSGGGVAGTAANVEAPPVVPQPVMIQRRAPVKKTSASLPSANERRRPKMR